jgi:probable H4MPT-linked C1 transfer pathway protein
MAVIGWDLGGVHLKAARAEAGRIIDAAQFASPLRSGLAPLRAAFADAKARMGAAELHAVTMTGELADTFASRAEGVTALAQVAAEELSDAPVLLYAGRAGFVPPQQAAAHVADIASANWHASAALVARRVQDALFVDVGSTTTDLVPVAGGALVARGYTDAERLGCGELVYTGLVRSFLMAMAERVPFAGGWTTLIRENFATMADVHRILGSLPEAADRMPTADGRAKTVAASRARLARMVGCDAGDAPDDAWTALAGWFAEAQIRQIADAAMLVLSRAPLPADAPVVGAGIGTGVIQECARRLGRRYLAFEHLLEAAPQARAAASQCAPAAALALLAAEAAL